MNPLRTLIVDDEPLARDRLRAMLGRESDIAILGECGNGPDAIAAIRRDQPDLVFLDVQMPGCDGLQVVADLAPEERPAVVFVTAHEEFAVEAFAVRAIDYLLKPFDQDRVHEAVQRALEYQETKKAGDLGTRLESVLADSGKPARLAVKAEGRIVFLRPEEIVWIEASDNYVIIHGADGSRLMQRGTLSAMEEKLGSAGFARVNRSALVNLDQVRELQPTLHGDHDVVLRNGTHVPLSRNLRGDFEKLIAGRQ